MNQTCTLIIFSVCAAACIALYCGGCAIEKNWYPMFVVIPCVLAIVFAYLFMSTGEGGLEGGCISKDTWLFCCICCIVSVIGLPLVLYHCDIIGWKGLVMQLCGDLVILIGFILYVVLSRTSSGIGYMY